MSIYIYKYTNTECILKIFKYKNVYIYINITLYIKYIFYVNITYFLKHIHACVCMYSIYIHNKYTQYSNMYYVNKTFILDAINHD